MRIVGRLAFLTTAAPAILLSLTLAGCQGETEAPFEPPPVVVTPDDTVLFPERDRFAGLKSGGHLASPAVAAAKVLTYLDRPDFGANPVADDRLGWTGADVLLRSGHERSEAAAL